MKDRKKEVRFQLHLFEGRSFICPDSTVSADTLVALLLPRRRVDPRDLYVFVINEDGSHSVSRRKLKLIGNAKVTVTIPVFSTATKEKEIEIEAVRKYMADLTEDRKTLLKSRINQPQS